MANLTKIKHVRIYVSTSPAPGASDCSAALNYLTSNSIPHHVVDLPGLDPTFLTQFGFSQFGSNNQSSPVQAFPVTLWKEFYDDGTFINQIAKGLTGLTASTLVANKAKIV